MLCVSGLNCSVQHLVGCYNWGLLRAENGGWRCLALCVSGLNCSVQHLVGCYNWGLLRAENGC